MSYDIWVDFNELGKTGTHELTSLLKFASDHKKIKADHRVIVSDAEGNTCKALVRSVERSTGIVTLSLFMDTFKAAE